MQPRVLALVLLGFACSPRTAPQTTPPGDRPASIASRWASDLRGLDSARRSGDAATTMKLLAEMRGLAPNNPQLAFATARVAAEQGNLDEAARWLAQYAATGLTLGPEAAKLMAALASDSRTPEVTDRLAANGRPIGAAELAFALPAGDRLFEDVAWDPQARVFYVSSVRDRRVYRVDATGGDPRPLTEPEPEGTGVVGAAFDPVRRVLWIASAPLPPVPGYRKGDDTARPSSLASVDVSTGRVTRRFELPADGKPHALTDLAISRRGDVLVSDSSGGGLYIVRAGRPALERLSADFDSPQTPAPRDDTTVYVADYSLGIARVDVGTGRVSWLSAQPSIALSGIDGLYAIGDALVAIQNGTQPPRIIRLALSPDGAAVVSATVLAQSPELGEPTHGAIVEGQLWFLAGGGWSRFDDGGALVKDPPPDRPSIWRVPTGA